MTLAFSNRKAAFAGFAASAASVYAAVYFLSRSPGALLHPERMAWASMADLVCTVPMLYYWMVVRAGHAAWGSLAAVVVAGARVYALLRPAALLRNLPGTAWFAVPLEIWIFSTILMRLRAIGGEGDPLDRLHAAAGSIFPNETLRRVAASELEVFYYALFSWRRQPAVPERAEAFSYSEQSGYGMFTAFLAIAVVIEGIPSHLLVSHWSRAAAWILNGLSAYSLLWLVAAHRSLSLNPVLVSPGRLLLRVGMIWRIDIPLAAVAQIRQSPAAPPERGEAGYLRLAMGTDPAWILELSEPVEALGPYGIRRRVQRIGIAPDDPPGLLAAIRRHSI